GLARYDAALPRASGFAAIQASGKSSSSRSAGWLGSRTKTSLRYANGTTWPHTWPSNERIEGARGPATHHGRRLDRLHGFTPSRLLGSSPRPPTSRPPGFRAAGKAPVAPGENPSPPLPGIPIHTYLSEF